MQVVDSNNAYAALGQSTRYVGLWKMPITVGNCPDEDVN